MYTYLDVHVCIALAVCVRVCECASVYIYIYMYMRARAQYNMIWRIRACHILNLSPISPTAYSVLVLVPNEVREKGGRWYCWGLVGGGAGVG